MQFRRAPPSSRSSTQYIIQTTLQAISNSQRLIRSIKQIMQGREMMLRATMTTHKFTVGEAVSFWPDKGQDTPEANSSRLFAYSLKRKMRPNTASKARPTTTSASFEKTSSRRRERRDCLLLGFQREPDGGDA